MALVATIGGVNRTSVLKAESLSVEHRAAGFVSVCSLTLIDVNHNITISEEDTITLIDGATTFFSGRVVNVNYRTFTTASRNICLECQDENAQLGEVVIDDEEVFTAQADSAIIDSLFDDYLPAVDSQTHVATIQNPLTITVGPCTLRSALSQICTRSGGYFYIDFDNKLHYFSAEADVVAWWLSDDPDQIDSFSYFDTPTKSLRAATRLDGIYVVGGGVEGWRGTHGVGDRTAIVRDNRITTATGVNQRGDAVLNEYGSAQVVYNVSTYKAGLEAGMDVRFICALYGVDATLTVRIMVVRWEKGGTAYYELELGDPVNPSLIGERLWLDTITEALGPITAPRLPTSSKGWSHGLVFSATDHDTVTWAAGDIVLADGTTYNIVAGNTGNIAAITYIFLDLDTSETILQLTTDSSVAVGSKKIMIAWAQNQAAGMDATYSVFGGAGQGVLVDTAQIVDDAITAAKTRIGLQGWSHGLVFSATDHNTVTWTDGTIEMADGTTFNITQSNTGNISAITYIYLDTDVSVTLLRTTTNVTNAVGDNKILVAWAKNQTAGLEATFATFGGEGQGVIVDTAQIVSNAITAAKTRIGLQGWSHDLVFSASDHNTVAWASGTIELADGTTLNITGTNTGNIAAVTYIYLDTDVSSVSLQTTTTVANTVGDNKVLIAVAENVAAGKDATFQTFGGEGLGVMVTAGQVVANTITANEIATNTITATEILANTITAAEIAADTITAAEILANTITATEIAANTITADQILANTITTTEIAATTIVAGNIAGNTITAAEIAVGTITASEIAVNTITSAEILANTITAVEIAVNTITATQILGNTITAAEIAANVITTNEIAVNTILAGNIASGAIETDKLDALAVTAAKIAANTITANKISMEMGNLIFNKADGLLLLGPHSEINDTEWWSLQRQKATISGAFNQVAGRFPGTRALRVEPTGLNYALAPRMIESGTTGLAAGWTYQDNLGSGNDATKDIVPHPIVKRGWLQRFTYTGVAGDANDYCKLEDDTAVGSFAQGDDVTISVDVKGSLTGCDFYIVGYEVDAAGNSGTSHLSSSISLSHSLEREEYTFATVDADCSKIRVVFHISNIDNGDELDVWFGAVNCEKTGYSTSFMHGGLSWCDWSGTADNSTSTRTKTEVNLDTQANLISANDTLTFAMWVQMPFDADVTWPSAHARVFVTKGADFDNYISFAFKHASDDWAVYINGAYRLDSPVRTFQAGDWIHLALTSDFAANSHKLYENGILMDTDTTALTAPVLTEWNIGTRVPGTEGVGFAFDEHAVYDRVLTAAEIAALYVLQRPLIDAGASDVPGLYILDGKFRIASSVSGNRIEIVADEIAGYSAAGVKQFYLQASDGKAMAGAGDVILDEDGLTLAAGSTETNFIKWKDSTFTVADLYATKLDNYLTLGITTNMPSETNRYSQVQITAEGPSGYSDAKIWLRSHSSVLNELIRFTADVVMVANGDAFRVGTGTADPTTDIEDGMLFYRTDTDKLRLRANSAWVNLN